MPVNKKSRRRFLASALAATAVAEAQSPDLPPGAPPAFNTGPAVGPVVSEATFAEAEKLMQVTMTRPQRAMAAASWRTALASVYERRTGPKNVAIEAAIAPATRWDPGLLAAPKVTQDRFVRSA